MRLKPSLKRSPKRHAMRVSLPPFAVSLWSRRRSSVAVKAGVSTSATTTDNTIDETTVIEN